MLNIRFLFQRYLILFLNLLFQVVLFRFLSITNAGIISYGRTLVQYFDYTNLGLRNTLDKKRYKNKASLSVLFSYVRTINLCISIILALFLIIFSLDEKILFLFIIVGIIYVDVFYVKLFYRNEGNKEKYVKKSFVFEIIPIVTLLICTLIFKNTILIGISFLISNILMYWIFNKDLKKIPLVALSKISLRFIKKIIRVNFNQGVFMFLSSLLFFFIVVGDRILIKEIYGFDVVAKISFLMLFINGFTPFVSALIEINMKGMLHDFPIRKIFIILLLVFIVGIFFIVVLFYTQNFIVDSFFKKYTDLKNYLAIFSILIFPYAMIQIFSLLLFRIHRQFSSFFVFLSVTFIHIIFLIVPNIFSSEAIVNILIIKAISLNLVVISMITVYIYSHQIVTKKS